MDLEQEAAGEIENENEIKHQNTAKILNKHITQMDVMNRELEARLVETMK